MKYILDILRTDPEGRRYRQSFEYEAVDENDTVASALKFLQDKPELTDTDGNPARPVAWECSCLQKKCGACAMVINGRPGLACDALLKSYKNGKIRLEPLRKFPVVRDLIVDRSIMYENLKRLKLWLKTDSILPDSLRDTAYTASECLQCGCCLEVCPNFAAGGEFCGPAALPLTTRLLTETDLKNGKELSKLYTQHIFEGCGKSLACRDICPRRINTENLLVNANALAIWKRRNDR